MRHVVFRLIACAVLPFASSIATAHPPGFEDHRFNDKNNPVTEGDVTTFKLQHGQCSNVDFGDGRGETDCKKGNIRSILAYRPNGKMGQSVDIRFDLRIDPSFAYPGRWSEQSIRGAHQRRLGQPPSHRELGRRSASQLHLLVEAGRPTGCLIPRQAVPKSGAVWRMDHLLDEDPLVGGQEGLGQGDVRR